LLFCQFLGCALCAIDGRRVRPSGRGKRCAALTQPRRNPNHNQSTTTQQKGMGGQRDTGLHKYSAYFADAGLAVFTFDYRCVCMCVWEGGGQG
jgi:hypothetical protein